MQTVADSAIMDLGAERPSQPRVGPNAIIQTAAALRSLAGEDTARTVFARAGLAPLLDDPPEHMVDQGQVRALLASLFTGLGAQEGARIAREAGRRTADYVMANRIQGPARWALKLLPARLAAPVLLNAIRQHAWTFAGSGAFSVTLGAPHLIEITDNPLAIGHCEWQRAVFRRMFRELVSHRVRITHPACCGEGSPVCRFHVSLDGRATRWRMS